MMIARLTRLATFVVYVALAAIAWLTWDVFFGAPEAETQPTSPTASAESPGPEAVSDLKIFESSTGHFDGQITVHNNSAADISVLVSVNVYDGEQNVGELSGDVTLKPDSESSLDLFSLDEFTEYTDTRVNLTGFAP